MSGERIAVFVSPTWSDQMRLRVWAKSLAPNVLVLLNDEATEGNAVLLRQLKCSDVVCFVARIPGMMRSLKAIEAGRERRDQAMASVATLVIDFGEQPGGRERFASHQVPVCVIEEK